MFNAAISPVGIPASGGLQDIDVRRWIVRSELNALAHRNRWLASLTYLSAIITLLAIMVAAKQIAAVFGLNPVWYELDRMQALALAAVIVLTIVSVAIAINAHFASIKTSVFRLQMLHSDAIEDRD